jgi:hypothetical protein
MTSPVYERGRFKSLIFIASAVLLSCASAPAEPKPHDKTPPNVKTEASLNGTRPKPEDAGLLSRLPISFEQNVGQADPKLLYLSRTPGAVVSLGAREMYVTVTGGTATPGAKRQDRKASPQSMTLRFGFSGANVEPRLETTNNLPSKTNYYLGSDPSRWRTNIANYGGVRYRELYPGIDLLFHGGHGQLEYDFVVAPGADAGAIQMELDPAATARILHGLLELRTATGVLKFAPPILYQEKNGSRETVSGSFVLLTKNRVGFRVGKYDHNAPLVIDPVLTYSTLLTGGNATTSVGIAVDAAGEITVAGNTGAIGFPVTNNSTFGGGTGVFVARIASSGTALVYSTFFGGSGSDKPSGMAEDSQGNAYVAGSTSSPNFPTTPGAFRSACVMTNGSCSTSFTAKFGPTGNLIYSTYLSGGTGVNAIAVDSQGSAYVAGGVASNSLDTVNAFQSQYVGLVSTTTEDAFVQKLDPTGSSLVYSTYLAPIGVPNGVQQTGATGIAVDGSGSAYVTGQTTATTFPTQNNSLSLNADHGIFVVKFKPDGSDLEYAAGIGGSGTDAPTAIALDPSGDAYITGLTGSADFPVTPNAFLPTCTLYATNTCESGQIFVLEVSADGSSLVYTSLLGAGSAGGIAVDASGNAYVTGSTGQATFPVVNPIEANLQVTVNSSSDAYVTALDSTGTPFFSTFLGGSDTGDAGRAIAVDGKGGIYVTGTTGASDLGDLVDFPLVNPGEMFLPCCGMSATFVSTIQLNATGPKISVSPPFAPIVVIRNVGSSALNISNLGSSTSIFYGGDCTIPGTLPAGTGCYLVTEPTILTFTTNIPGPPEQFLVSPTPNGIGAPGPFVSPSATNLQFPAQLIGTTSGPEVVTLTNAGTAATTITSALVGGPYKLVNNCPSVLSPGISCSLQVTFVPNGIGALSGILVINYTTVGQMDIYLGGTGSSNGLAASTSSIEFQTEYLGTTYQPRTVVLSNVDVAPVTLTGFSVSSEYTQTNNCPPVLAVGGNCRVFVSFNPTGNGEVQGTLTVTHSSTGGSQTVQLDGTGLILSNLSVSPLQLSLGTTLGQTPGTAVETLQNTSSQSISIGTVTATPSVFTVTGNTCPASLAPQATCTVTVTFTPTVVGTVNGQLTIVHGGTGNPQIVSVTGIAATQLRFTPTSVSFGDEEINNTSAQSGVSIGNNLSTPVTIQSISISGDFQIVPGGLVPPYQLQGFFGTELPLTFTPTALGLRNGMLTVTATDSPTPHQIPLTGNGIGTGLNILPGTLNFSNVPAGTTSTAMPVTVTNTSATAVTMQSFALSGPFTQTNNCGSSLAAAATCTIQVFYAPTTVGSSSSVLTVTDSADGSPQTVNIQGMGTGPSLIFSSASLNFNDQAVGMASGVLSVKVTNELQGTISLSSIAASGDFSETNNCGGGLASLGNCTINVTFTPTAMGTRAGTVTITDNGPDGQQSISLAGTGTGTPAVALTTNSMNFGNVVVGATVTPQTVTMNVTGNPVSIQGITLSSPMFTQQNTCPGGGVAAGGSCAITVTLRATAPGPVSATMQIQDDAPNSPQTVQLQASASNYNMVQVSGSGQTILAGQTATFTGSIGTIAGLTEMVTLSCTGAPSQSSCNLSQTSFSLNTLNQQFTASVPTTARTSGMLVVPSDWSHRFPVSHFPRVVIPRLAWWGAFGLAIWALLVTCRVLPRRDESLRQMSGRFIVTCGFLVVALVMISCGGGESGGTVTTAPAGTPAGNYTIVITGTSSNPADPVQTVQFSFTVQ